jgi:hypothetical protein
MRICAYKQTYAGTQACTHAHTSKHISAPWHSQKLAFELVDVLWLDLLRQNKEPSKIHDTAAVNLAFDLHRSRQGCWQIRGDRYVTSCLAFPLVADIAIIFVSRDRSKHCPSKDRFLHEAVVLLQKHD